MYKRLKIFACVVMVLAVAGCGLTRGEEKMSPVGAPAASVEASHDAPEVTALRALWSGVRCTQPEEAEARLSALLVTMPDQPLALALRGLARSEMAKREPAFEDMTEALRRRPTAEMYAWRGLVLWRNANPRGAERDARYALRKSPGDALATMVLGLALKEQGREGEACGPLREACAGGQCFGLEEVRKADLCQ